MNLLRPIFLLLSLPLIAADSATAGPWDYANEVAPILERHCLECHGPDKKKADLRLDLRAGAMRGSSDGPVILSGKSQESLLIQKVSSGDDDERMPPKGPGLSVAEIATLTRWIDAGAPWPDSHAGEDERLAHWAWQSLRTPQTKSIDAFVDAKLAKAKLTRSAPADRRTLIRRLTFVLHGLPPTPEDVAAFVADPDPQAYEKLVDRLHASPHYGERMAQHWFDLAHYADTHGFERDKRRPHAWPYRDWVIGAFNADTPYMDFLREQLAGDPIPTGFLAAGPWDFVGQVEAKSGILKRSARNLDLDDMATQVMTATMAMTINCARCHDHKLDPISQKEYYQFRAVFADLRRADGPVANSARQALEAKRQKVIDAILEIAPGHDLAALVGAGIDPRTGKAQGKRMGFLDKVVNNRFGASDLPHIDGVVIPKSGADIPISSTGLTVSDIPGADGKAWDAIRHGPANGTHSTKHGGIDFAKNMLGLHANAAITFDLRGLRRAGQRFVAQIGYFGKAEDQYHADGWVFLDGKKVCEFRKLMRSDGLQSIDVPLPESARFLTLMATADGNGISMDQIAFINPRLQIDDPRLGPLEAEMATLDAEIANLSQDKVYTTVSQPSETIRLLRRGNPEAAVGEPLSPGAFRLLPMKPELAGKPREALGAWITDPHNPLTPRVIANRLWHWAFGQGIVNTPSDFGLGGDRPSHPELLDWLAAQLGRRAGSLKAIWRLILTSETWKQDSRFVDGAEGVAKDAGNRLLWRQNPRRLEAEAIRDSVLAVSGKLNLERGGPGFEDFEYKQAYAPIYSYVTADKPALWRRSIYRYRVRTTPDRFLTTLDCPDTANLTPKRLNTTTPLQSLALFNNDFMLRQSRYFAERLAAEPDVETQVRRAFELAFARGPSAIELELSTYFIEAEGLFAFCRSLYNANEFVYVD
jgi:mono/diheme cytochrome c family protein